MFRQKDAVNDLDMAIELKIVGQGLEQGLGLTRGDGEKNPVPGFDRLS
jgi:hypothetical protein